MGTRAARLDRNGMPSAPFVGPGGREQRLASLLGVPAGEDDPVRIIIAAQVRLRQWRRLAAENGHPTPVVASRIRLILDARDRLLRRGLDLAARS